MRKNQKAKPEKRKQLNWMTALKNYHGESSVENIRALVDAVKYSANASAEITASTSKMESLVETHDALELQIEMHNISLKLAKSEVKHADEKIPQLKNNLLIAQARLGKPKLLQNWFPSSRLKAKQLEVNKCDRALRDARVEFNNTNWRIDNINKVIEKLVKQQENLVLCLREQADVLDGEPDGLDELADDIAMGSIVIT